MQSYNRQTRIMWEQQMSVHYKNFLLNVLFTIIKWKGNNWFDMQELSNTVSKIVKEQLPVIYKFKAVLVDCS